MKINLGKLNKNALRILRQVGQAADRQGLPVYAVGGFVRDLILKKDNMDIDIVVEGDAPAFAAALAQELRADVKVYREFGTATLTFSNGRRLDFVRARQEVYPRPGALPVVSPGSIRDDLFRRDFTVNAMAMVINKSRFGELVDIFGGLGDLKKRRIRILHDKSFLDDPTRILRAVRFEQRFDFRIEPRSLALLVAAIKNDYVKNVTLPRYVEEFKKVLSEPRPVKSLKRLNQFRGLDFLKEKIRPNFAALALMERNIVQIQKNALYKNWGEWWLVYLMGLVESWPAICVVERAESLRLTRQEKAGLAAVPAVGPIIEKLKQKNLKPHQIYELLSGLPRPIICFIRVRTSGNIVGRHVDNFLKIYSKVKLRTTGEDLKRAGIPEGKVLGQVVHELLLRKIDGKIKSTAKELEEAHQVNNMLKEKE